MDTQLSAPMQQPMLRARIFRCLRWLDCLPRWRGVVERCVPPHAAKFTVHNGGTSFTGDIASFIDREIFLHGVYEKDEIKAFLERIPSNRRGTVLDVGGNVGNHSLAFARVFKTVHAFEPNPMLWSQFESNVSLNGLAGRVHLHRVGLADRDDELTLHLIDKPNFGLGTFSTVEQYDLPLKAVARCLIRQGSTYLKTIGVGTVDAVKIDVQGFEPEVLIGLAEVLKRDKPSIWCEIGDGTLATMGTIEALERIIPFSFDLLMFGKSGFQRVHPPLAIGNYMFVPR